MRSTTNTLLTSLAVSDMLTMLSYVPWALHFYCLHGTEASPARNTLPWICFFLFHVNFTVTTHTTSIWLGVLLSLSRYTYVKLSQNSVLRCTPIRTKYAVMCVYLGSTIILVPNYISLRIVMHHDPVTNSTIYDLASVDMNTTFGRVLTSVNFWIHAIVIKIIPCALMSVFGLLLVWTLKHTHKRSMQLRRSSRADGRRMRTRDHSRTTRMLIVVIVLFLITELPQGILALCSGLVPNLYEAYYQPLGDTMDIVALINNSINFVLYCSMSKQFRETFISLFCFRQGLHNPMDNLATAADGGHSRTRSVLMARNGYNRQPASMRTSISKSHINKCTHL